jgi:hypothetical protein
MISSIDTMRMRLIFQDLLYFGPSGSALSEGFSTIPFLAPYKAAFATTATGAPVEKFYSVALTLV